MGVVIAVIGAIIFLLGLGLDSTIIGLPAGMTLNGIGGATSGIGSIIGGIGYFMKRGIVDLHFKQTKKFKDNGKENFIHGVRRTIECDPAKYYDIIDKPKPPVSLLEGEHELLQETLNRVLEKEYK